MPHFAIIHNDGTVEDYSLDAVKSPSITSYPQFPKSGRDACALFYAKSMKVVMKPKTSKELIEWKFDDQTPQFTNSQTWDNDENSRTKGLCATSSTGKLFIYSGLMDSNTIHIHFNLKKYQIAISIYLIKGSSGGSFGLSTGPIHTTVSHSCSSPFFTN